MATKIELDGTMPPCGDPSSYRSRFPVHIVAECEDPGSGWYAIATYFSPDTAFTGEIPPNLLIGFTPEEYYALFSQIYNELLDNLGFTPSSK